VVLWFVFFSFCAAEPTEPSITNPCKYFGCEKENVINPQEIETARSDLITAGRCPTSNPQPTEFKPTETGTDTQLI
jgi:hypothetical protein